MSACSGSRCSSSPATGHSLLVNEIAPRVHNSGHWTLDGGAVDQFEQHIRAIAGWPLGPPAAMAEVTMTNLIGDESHGSRLAGEPGAHLISTARARRGPAARWATSPQVRRRRARDHLIDRLRRTRSGFRAAAAWLKPRPRVDIPVPIWYVRALDAKGVA